MLVSLLVFIVGLMNIASSFGRGVPERLLFLENLIPVEVSNLSRTLTLIIGFLLLFLAYGLNSRRIRAWKISMTLLTVSLFLHLIKGLDYEEVLVIGGSLIVLVLSKNQFRVSSSRTTWVKSLLRSVLILLGLFIYASLGYFLFDKQFTNEVNLMNIQKDYLFSIFGIGKDTLIPLTRQARWFQESISVVGWSSLVLALFSMFAPVIPESVLEPNQRRWLYTLVKKYGKGYLSYFSLMDDKQIFFSTDDRAALSFKINGATAVVLGSPIGSVDHWGELIREFGSFCESGGLGMIFYCLTSQEKDWLMNQLKGWSAVEVGDWAVISLEKFKIESPQLSEIRHGISRFEREGFEMGIYKLAEVPWSVLKELTQLRNDWLESKGVKRIGFSNDYFPLPVENDGFLAVAKSTKGIVAGLTLFPTADKGLVLDMMVRDINLNNGIMDGFMAKALLELKSRGYERVCLGLAAQVGGVLGKVAKRFDRLFKFRSLRKFKSKFDPKWEKAFVVYKNRSRLPQVLLTLIRVHIDR